MAVFSGSEFMYDNILSSKFGLMIAYIDQVNEHSISSNITLITKQLPRRSKVYRLGVQVDKPFEFQISFFREQDRPIESYEKDIISRWLLGDYSFRQLKIIQDDMCSVYYNCCFTELRYIAFGGYANGFVATVLCDAPFAWRNTQTKEIVNQPNANGNYPNQTSIQIHNFSSDHNLTMPKLVEVDLSDTNNRFRLTNLSNGSEYFEFNDLVVGDKIKMDDMCCIECVNRPNSPIVDNFSGEFLELIHGVNRIQVDGQIKRLKIIYQSGVKIG